MRITYNDPYENRSNIITFSDIPNILKVTEEDYGTQARIALTFNGSLRNVTNADNQWYITYMNETVTNTLQPSNAKNKHFYVGTDNASTAAYVAMALRNCSGIAANNTIQHTGNQVIILSKSIGEKWSDGISNYFETNIPQAYITANYQDGSASSNLNGAEIVVDISSNGDYVTTLQKYWWNGEAAFNLTPFLSTMVTPLNVYPYTMQVSSIKDGAYTYLGSVGENYATVGYMCNQGQKWLDNSGLQLAQNVSRGSSNTGLMNSSVLYTYNRSIPISFYNGNSGGMTITVEYLNSAYEVIGSGSTAWQNSDSSKKLWHLDLTLDNRWFYQSYYFDVTLGNIKIRYKSIRPYTMTEECTRIQWVNSYGGISFFDFTGKKVINRTVETETYQKGIFDYYEAGKEELDKIYTNDVKYDVTLKSHLLEKDGTYIFNDLLQSPDAWTVVNGVTYGIIIDSVAVDELDNNNDVYEATVRYHYSQPTTLI